MTDPAKPSTLFERASKNPYFFVGITFFVLGVSFLVNESTRGTAFAFLPIGITFFALAFYEKKVEPRTADSTDPEPPTTQ